MPACGITGPESGIIAQPIPQMSPMLSAPRKNGAASPTRLAVAALIAAPLAAPAESLGRFEAWNAQASDDAGGRVCSLWTQPEKSEGKYKRRGEVFVFVTHAPSKGAFDSVSLEIGYDFKADSVATVRIGKRSFELNAGGSAAWAKTAEDDRRLVSAMRGGRSMVVEGVSSRGTETRDTYSLYGFSAAHDAIGKACPR